MNSLTLVKQEESDFYKNSAGLSKINSQSQMMSRSDLGVQQNDLVTINP